MESVKEVDEEEGSLRGQAQVWQLMFGFADSMALKSAVELRLADIIHSHGGPITLSQIASGIDSSSPDIPYLARLMRMLVRKGIFTANDHPSSDGGDDHQTEYGLTHISKWLLHDSELSLAPMVVMENNPWQLAPWHYLANCVKQGGIAFEKAHGCDMWDFASRNREFNKLFNDGLASATKIVMTAFVPRYKDGFDTVRSLVDVGGGTGGAIAEIVKTYPHIEGINFDLPHVVATAPDYDGVSHVGGNMFESIPNADAVFMKAGLQHSSLLVAKPMKDSLFVLRLLLKLLVEVVTTHSLAATIVVNDGDNLSIKRLLSTQQSLLWREIDCKWRQKKTLKNC
ncbi:hypothetical protein LWI29_033628 [Acer saccharum]|uniref:Uncharacterized protein n=1 Tax=Acer saccharum TaxID=4024 RepID=A0AA39S573_ACESA|nr:hypothetical protein LWI29_033628 [Acer saccharum]